MRERRKRRYPPSVMGDSNAYRKARWQDNQASSVTVSAPSTSANLGPGFDVFALALDAFRDEVKVELVSEPGVRILLAETSEKPIPIDPEHNSAGPPALEALRRIMLDQGLEITIKKNIPVAKGLGSSAASAAACAYALDQLLNLQLSFNELIELASLGEKVVSGSSHADNVAAAILGGFTIVYSYNPVEAISLALPANLEIALAIPEIEIGTFKTRMARAVLPESVPLPDLVYNVGKASAIVAALLLGDIKLLRNAMIDRIIEPVRGNLVKGYAAVRKSALDAGCAGVAISGAGPTMIALVDAAEIDAFQVAKAMAEAFEENSIQARAIACKPTYGARLIEAG
jgi:homoserine kinase